MYRILIVEDDAIIAKAIKKGVESWGYSGDVIKNFQDVLGEFAA